MEPRAAAGLLVSALIRRTEAAGGSAMVLARGDAIAGSILVQLAARGIPGALIERTFGVGGYGWGPIGPDDPGERDAYLARRRRSDPDLWIVELDAPEAAAIVAEVIG